MGLHWIIAILTLHGYGYQGMQSLTVQWNTATTGLLHGNHQVTTLFVLNNTSLKYLTWKSANLCFHLYLCISMILQPDCGMALFDCECSPMMKQYAERANEGQQSQEKLPTTHAGHQA